MFCDNFPHPRTPVFVPDGSQCSINTLSTLIVKNPTNALHLAFLTTSSHFKLFWTTSNHLYVKNTWFRLRSSTYLLFFVAIEIRGLQFSEHQYQAYFLGVAFHLAEIALGPLKSQCWQHFYIRSVWVSKFTKWPNSSQLDDYQDQASSPLGQLSPFEFRNISKFRTFRQPQLRITSICCRSWTLDSFISLVIRRPT